MNRLQINNWGDLKSFANQLSEDELQKPVKVWGEGFNHTVEMAEVIEEDMINPSGDGCEPVSAYSDDPELLADERVVVSKGEVYLTAQ